ncbi:MAG: hypothetical protein CMD30_03335 [Flavobacteriales bacterium]|nr:hypothetical protein [Flavobacteriales bacterium]
MTSSMTGFGHSRHINKETEIYCEIKSVNHRFLDISIKPNDISNELDLFIRDAISKKVKRGTLDIRLKLKFPSSNSYIINNESLRNLGKSIDGVKLLEIKKLTFSDIKDIPGIIKTEQKIQVNQNLIKKVFKDAFKTFLLNRAAEGEKINKLFLSKLNKINKCISKLESSNKKLLKIRSESLKKKVHNICETVDKDRLAQEVALLALKHDVAEEIERINFHTSSLKKELVSRSGSGKKIDFILQELFRETSTLSVKLDIPRYKQIALDMKLIVEEMREQAQNIE